MSNNGRPTNHDISSIGMHEVSIELLWHGFKPEKAVNERRAVLSVTNRDTGKTIKLFVKVTKKDCKREKLLNGKVLVWPMDVNDERLSEPGVVFCFVYIELPTHQAHFFIVPGESVIDNLNKQFDYWLKVANRTKTGDEEFPARFCIGVDTTAKYSISIPMEADYKNMWDLLT